MEIREEKRGAVVLVGLEGRLDASTSPKLEEKLLGLIDGGATKVVVNVARLDYISSAGLRVLLMAAKRLKAAQGKIVLAAPQDHIRVVFEIAGFSAIFPMFASDDEAVRNVQ